MIYVGGAPFASDDSSQGMDTMIALLKHPALVAATNSFKSIAERKILFSQISSSGRSRTSKLAYIFQKEFATVDPTFVDLVGTDGTTTCIGIVIRNCKSGLVCVAHMDFPKVVDAGLDQMLSLVADNDYDALLDHSSDLASKSHMKLEGYSYSLCAKIIEILKNRNEKFQIKTMHVLWHNTRWDSDGIAYPIFHGFVVETSDGSIAPASFDKTSRCPDEIVRRIRVTAAFEDPKLTRRLLETYETKTDRFVIAPCLWSMRQSQIALALQKLSDTEILNTCSTSPSAENPDFVDNKRKWDYLIRHPNWNETFPRGRPRVFQRSEDGNWLPL